MFNMQWISIYSYECVRYATNYLCLIFDTMTFPTWGNAHLQCNYLLRMLLSKVTILQM